MPTTSTRQITGPVHTQLLGPVMPVGTVSINSADSLNHRAILTEVLDPVVSAGATWTAPTAQHSDNKDKGLTATTDKRHPSTTNTFTPTIYGSEHLPTAYRRHRQHGYNGQRLPGTTNTFTPTTYRYDSDIYQTTCRCDCPPCLGENRVEIHPRPSRV